MPELRPGPSRRRRSRAPRARSPRRRPSRRCRDARDGGRTLPAAAPAGPRREQGRLARARSHAGPRRGAGARLRPRGLGAAAARGAADRAARRASPHRHRPRRLRGRGHAVPGRALHDRRVARRPARARAGGPAGAAGGDRRRAARSRTRSPTRTRTASCTATSSPTTSGSTPRARPRSATSASRWPRARRRRRPGRRATRRPSRRWARRRRRAADLFALGVTLYELLCGVRPFDSKDVFRMRTPAPPSSLVPGVPEELDRLILALVAPDPADRPADAAVVAAALDAPDRARARGAGRAGRARRPRPGARTPARRAPQAWSGAARTVVVAGEPGIGKTTLLDALATEAGRRGGVAVWGRGEPEGRAYGVWRPVVRVADRRSWRASRTRRSGRCSARPPAPGGEEERLRLYDAVADLLGGRRGRRARCSSCSTTCTGPTRRRCGCSRTSPAPSPPRGCCWRAPTRRASWRSAEVLHEIEGDPRAERMELAGLGARGRARAAAGRGGAADRRARPRAHAPATRSTSPSSSGCSRPRAGSATTPATLVPARVREVVRRRVERLGDEACAVLEVGAVAGRFTIADLVRAAGVSRAAAAAALDRGTAAGLVTAASQAPGTSPSRTGSSATPCARRCPSSGAARSTRPSPSALIVRRDAGADVPAAQIAHHALAAARAGADPQPAWEAALEAAREAERLARPRRGRRALRGGARGARARGRGAGRRAPRRRCSTLAEATFAAGDIEDARRRYSQAAAAARRDGDARGAGPGRARVRPGAALRRGRRGERDAAQPGARAARGRRAAGPRDRAAVGLRARAAAPRGADRRGAGDGARRGDARVAVSRRR